MDLEELTGVIILPEKTYDVEIDEASDAVYDPFSHKILIECQKNKCRSNKRNPVLYYIWKRI